MKLRTNVWDKPIKRVILALLQQHDGELRYIAWCACGLVLSVIARTRQRTLFRSVCQIFCRVSNRLCSFGSGGSDESNIDHKTQLRVLLVLRSTPTAGWSRQRHRQWPFHWPPQGCCESRVQCQKRRTNGKFVPNFVL